MSGMEGMLTREDLQAAFQAGPCGSSRAAGSPAGERFLDVAAILRGGGDDDEDADLDGLVV